MVIFCTTIVSGHDGTGEHGRAVILFCVIHGRDRKSHNEAALASHGGQLTKMRRLKIIGVKYPIRYMLGRLFPWNSGRVVSTDLVRSTLQSARMRK